MAEVPSSTQDTPNPVQTDWEGEYKSLTSGEKSPEDFSPTQLFEMASFMAAGGNFAAKAEIYEEYILVHPYAIDDDKTRVQAYRADMKRRQGDAQGALADLETLTEPTDPMARTEYLQARSECRLILGDKSGYLSDKLAIATVCDEAGESIPLDRKLLYAGGVINALLEGDQLDGETVQRQLESYDRLRNDPGMPEDKKSYAAHEYHALAGIFEEKRGNLPGALAHYKAQHDVQHDTKFRAVAALRYLAAVWAKDPDDRAPVTMEMATFFRAHQSELLPAWIKVLQAKYDLVKRISESLS